MYANEGFRSVIVSRTILIPFDDSVRGIVFRQCQSNGVRDKALVPVDE